METDDLHEDGCHIAAVWYCSLLEGFCSCKVFCSHVPEPIVQAGSKSAMYVWESFWVTLLDLANEAMIAYLWLYEKMYKALIIQYW